MHQEPREDGSEGFKAEYFAELAQAEHSSFWFRSRNRLIVWALAKYFPDAASILEVGCGTGYVLAAIRKALPHLQAAGGEMFDQGLRFARERISGAPVVRMDARAIPFKHRFDVVGAFDVLEHIDDDELALRQIYEATGAGGGVLLTVPQHRFLWSHTDKLALHKRRYSSRELVRKVELAGFQTLRATSFVTALLPIMVLARLRRPDNPTPRDAVAELHLQPLLDQALEGVMTAERSLIRSGASLPFGGSLLLVARKQ